MANETAASTSDVPIVVKPSNFGKWFGRIMATVLILLGVGTAALTLLTSGTSNQSHSPSNTSRGVRIN
jgi:hypothetical protein